MIALSLKQLPSNETTADLDEFLTVSMAIA
jgi:hypothetical protein